jgi:hypothetical protein
MSNKTTSSFAIVAIALLAAGGLGSRWFVRARSQSSVSSCINSLREIDGASQQWALDHHAASNDVPTWTDLVGADRYMREMPVCPQGGTYSLARVTDRPRCSIGGPGHSLQ